MIRTVLPRTDQHLRGVSAQNADVPVKMDHFVERGVEPQEGCAAPRTTLEFERLLSELLSTFARLPSDQFDTALGEAFKKAHEFLGIDRSTIALFAKDSRQLQVLHSCAAEGFQEFPRIAVDRELPWWFEQIRNGRTVVMKRIPEESPRDAVHERAFMLREGYRSHLGIPLRAGGTVLGAIALDSFTSYSDWPDHMVSRLQSLADIFATALARKRSEESLRAALAENKKLRERLEWENLQLRSQAIPKHHHGRIVGQSDALKKTLAETEQVAVTDAPVLLLGETGTGKELLAQTIHELSRRKDRPMVVVNCASLPATLIESELFGREAGAYTGAASAQVGRFVVADGSTLFLDEIGEFPVELQAKLLRVLQDGRFERLGSPRTVTVNVRIIAATNRDLEQAVRDNKFRADLYHRLNVFPIRVPPLRDRVDDIPALVWAFVEALGSRMGKTIKSIPRRSMEQLQRYSWPGNVRELANLIERAMILSTGDILHVDVPSIASTPVASRMTLKEIERAQILRVLQETGWRIRGDYGAAEILGLKPTTLEARMAKLGIKRNGYAH